MSRKADLAGVTTMTAEGKGGRLEAEGLSMVFNAGPDSVTALENASFSCNEGEFITFVGPSGCGKSTLLNIVAGLLQSTDGEVAFNGTPITSPQAEIGVMFQQPTLFPWRSALDNVILPAEIKGRDRADAKKRASELLEQVGLGEFASKLPAALSGGMQQRVALCRLLLQDPAVMLLDEPFGALDEFTREEMNRQLLDIWSGTNKTALLVTHNIQEAVFLADRVFVMTPRPGRIAEIIDVDLPRPRDLALTTTPEFQAIVLRIRTILGAL